MGGRGSFLTPILHWESTSGHSSNMYFTGWASISFAMMAVRDMGRMSFLRFCMGIDFGSGVSLNLPCAITGEQTPLGESLS